MAGHGIHVFVNSRKVRLDSGRVRARDLLRAAGYPEGEHWDLYRLRDQNDITGGTVVDCDDLLQVEDGDYFLAVQGHRTCA